MLATAPRTVRDRGAFRSLVPNMMITKLSGEWLANRIGSAHRVAIDGDGQIVKSG